MKPYTVVFDEPGDPVWQGFNCQADDSELAEEQCLDANPQAGIVWVNEGHSNFSQEPT